MKTKIVILIISAIVMGLTGTLSAQTKRARFAFSAGSAHSILVPMIPKTIEAASGSFTATTKGVKAIIQPGMNLSADIRVCQVLSLGVGLTYQKCGVEYIGRTYYKSSKQYTENCDLSISRVNVG